MLIVVKPGIVFTSLTKIAPPRSTRKSTRAMPAQSMAWNAAIDSRWISAAVPASSAAGMMICDPWSRYFAS
jgi:hypothetical protein